MLTQHAQAGDSGDLTGRAKAAFNAAGDKVDQTKHETSASANKNSI